MKKSLVSIIVLVIFCIFSSVGFGEEENMVVAYYFHTTFRCVSCHTIEQYTEGALNEYFPNELESGELVYKMINVEDKGSEHFINDYQLFTKSVVLSLVKNGNEIKFKNLEDVWPLLNNEAKFYQYIKEETQMFLDQLTGSTG